MSTLSARAFYIIVFGLVCTTAMCQLDSLAWLDNQPDDTIKVNLLIRFSKSFRETDFNKTLQLGNTAKSLSKRIGFTKGLFKANHNLCIIYTNHDQFGQGLKIIEEMIALADSLHNTPELIKAKFRLAKTNHFIGADFKSIKIYHEIMELLPQSVKNESLARCYWEMADCYSYMNEYKMAEDNATKALEFYSKTADHDAVMRLYITLGELRELQNQHVDASNNFKKAMTVLEQHTEIQYWRHFKSYIQVRWAISALNNNQIQIAFDLYNQALKVLKDDETVSKSTYALCMAGLGEVYLKRMEYSKAINHFETATAYYEEIKYYKPVLVNVYEKLINAYELSESFKKADETWKRLSILKDSVHARQQKKELMELNIRYQAARNEQQIAQLEKEQKFTNAIVLLLGGLVFAVFIFVWFAVRQQRLNYRNEKRELELIAMRCQMNPHFIFNCLNSINEFIIRSERELSSNYLSKFAKLIRLILNNSSATYVMFENELSALRFYLELEAMRFDGKFSYKIDVAPEIDSLKIETPSMIIQPYIENSIWHGLQHLSGDGKLLIDFKLKDKYVVCTIEDNGIGRPASSNTITSKRHRKSVEIHGTQIAQDRLHQMVKGGHRKASVTIIDLKSSDGNNCGTKVEVTLPFRPAFG
jgi:tetratricopeptide (TPR) repeat protein